MPKIYLQRHTRPDIDSKICYGATDIMLHKEYKEKHLPLVLEQINKLKIKHIYSSPLIRCKQLAIDIQSFLNIESVIFDSRIKEMNFGLWEMVSWEKIYKSKEGKVWFKDYLNLRTPEGEGFDDLVTRANDFITSIKHIEDNILVVTHGGFMRAMLVALGNTEKDKAFNLEIDYGQLIEVEI